MPVIKLKATNICKLVLMRLDFRKAVSFCKYIFINKILSLFDKNHLFIFRRALVQRCPEAQIKNLITLGGQHQGVFGLPNCPSLTQKTCEYLRQMLNYAAYTSLMQKYLVQATYWHNPLEEDNYMKKSTFLADINNERTKNLDYINRLQKLKSFVMVKFLNDTIVTPRESQWFGFYKPGQDVELQTLEDSDLFIKDKLGLQQMKTDGKLVYLATEGNHLQFKTEWFIENIINVYLRQD